MILMLPYLLPLLLMMESVVAEKAEKTPIFRLGSGVVVRSMAKADQLGATPPSRPSFDTYQLQRVLILLLTVGRHLLPDADGARRRSWPQWWRIT